jgi:hypothetical protein
VAVVAAVAAVAAVASVVVALVDIDTDGILALSLHYIN